jgi:hypothetical protein
VNRKKSPALTSPGKVGFLVALLMVVTALGVSYFITGTFALRWNWLDTGGALPASWRFNAGAFLDEMVPLIAMVALLAFAAHVLVAGAVRRYQSSVASGSEYRDLLRSFKNLEDFDDERRLEELKPHPELREFVMGFRNRLAARERQMEEREKRNKDASPKRAPSAELGNLASESAVLLSAIVNSNDGFGEGLPLSIPELKQIERAVRERLAHRAVPDDAARRELEALKASVDTTLATVHRAAQTARRDAASCVTGAREIEAQLASLKQAIDGLAVPATAAGGVNAATKRIDGIAEALAVLGEDTKRVAIAAALTASGGDGGGEAVKVADELRAIATRFNGVVQQWREASPSIRSAVETIASGAVGAEKRRASALKALQGVAGKTRLLGERLVALADAVGALDAVAGGKPGPVAGQASREWGEIGASAVEEVEAPAPAAPSPPEAAVDEDFVPQRAAAVFEDTDGDEAPFADIPGFEKDPHLFTDESGRKTGHDDDETDPRFVVEREAGGEWDLSRGTQAAETASTVDASQDARRSPPRAAPDDGFLTGPGGRAPAPKAAAPPSKRQRRIKVDDIAGAPAEEDAVDLYALGAVDYQAGVHA